MISWHMIGLYFFKGCNKMDNSTGVLKTVTITPTDHRLIKKVVKDSGIDVLALKSSMITEDEILIIPLKRNKSSNASNIVCNWMDDIIEIIEKGEKNFSKPDMVMSEIKAYCKSVKTTVTS